MHTDPGYFYIALTLSGQADKILEQHNVNTNAYRNIMYYLPAIVGDDCGWSGLGEVHGGTTWIAGTGQCARTVHFKQISNQPVGMVHTCACLAPINTSMPEPARVSV